MNHPFPDDINAEICAITGGPANARLQVMDGFRVIRGWYGSVVADLCTIDVFDDAMPEGPICDEEISKAIDEGRAAYRLDAYPTEAVKTMSAAAVKGIIARGAAMAEAAFEEVGVSSGAMSYMGDDGALAYPYSQIFNTESATPGYVDLRGAGGLIAAISRLRGEPLAPGPALDRAVDQAFERLVALRSLDPTP